MKIVSTSLSDQAYELVKGEILKGTIKAGSKISEDALATQFGVSRTPIREAIRRLAEYGLVTLSPRSHAAVVKISDKAAQDIASLRINLEFFAIDNLQENLFDVSVLISLKANDMLPIFTALSIESCAAIFTSEIVVK